MCRNLLGNGRCSRTVFVSISSGRYDLALYGTSDFGRLYVPAFAAFVQKQDIFAILKADTLNIIEFSFLGILGAQLGFYYTIGLCNAATATVLQYMAPLYVMLWMSYKSRKIPDVRELIGIVGALVGVFLIATHGSLDSLAISPMALTIGVLSALSYAYYSIKPGQMLKNILRQRLSAGASLSAAWH